MANVDPARFANEEQALNQNNPDYYDYDREPRPPKKRRLRHLVKRLVGRQGKTDG
jgi:hypothetical protein